MTIEAMKQKIAALPDNHVEEGAIALEFARSKAGCLVRALLVDEWERRHGPDAAEELMQKCGLATAAKETDR